MREFALNAGGLMMMMAVGGGGGAISATFRPNGREFNSD